jgi:hypothetical protein
MPQTAHARQRNFCQIIAPSRQSMAKAASQIPGPSKQSAPNIEIEKASASSAANAFAIRSKQALNDR